MRHLILLSGHIHSGKSALAKQLCERLDGSIIKTRELLERDLRSTSRADLQAAGTQRDIATDGEWLVEETASMLDALAEEAIAVVDAVWHLRQLDALRKRYDRAVTHIHVTASETERLRRAQEFPEFDPAEYAQAQSQAMEVQVDELRHDADLVIETDRSQPAQILIRALAGLRLSAHNEDQLVDVLVGGQWGSEGKGNIAAHLAPEYSLLVRTGGPNAGHSVYLPGDVTHVQHHLPSGTRVAGARLLLGPGAVIAPTSLMKEITESEVAPHRLFIDPQATIITQAHVDSERKLVAAIASTGRGIGAALADRITSRDKGVLLARDVPELKPYLREASDVLGEAFSRGERVFVEGTQGTGLSLLHGEYPHVTARDTTCAGLLAEAGIAPRRLRKVVMVCRVYPIRVSDPDGGVATSGRVYSELKWETVAQRSGLDLDDLLEQELTTTTRRQRRVGEFDWALLRRASELNGPTDIAVTFVDQLDAKNMAARRFEQLTPDTIRFIEEVESVAGAPASLISTRFHNRSVIDRRTW